MQGMVIKARGNGFDCWCWGSGLKSLALTLGLNDPNSICQVVWPDPSSRSPTSSPRPPIISTFSVTNAAGLRATHKSRGFAITGCGLFLCVGRNQRNAISMSDSRVTLPLCWVCPPLDHFQSPIPRHFHLLGQEDHHLAKVRVLRGQVRRRVKDLVRQMPLLTGQHLIWVNHNQGQAAQTVCPFRLMGFECLLEMGSYSTGSLMPD